MAINDLKINFRIPSREYELIKQAARVLDMTASEYMRLVLNNMSVGIVTSKSSKLTDEDYFQIAEIAAIGLKLKTYRLDDIRDEYDRIIDNMTGDEDG